MVIVPDRQGKFVDNHIENLWKETIVRLGTELQVKSYLEKASSYWDVDDPTEIASGAFRDRYVHFCHYIVFGRANSPVANQLLSATLSLPWLLILLLAYSRYD